MEEAPGGPRLYTKAKLCQLAGVTPRLIDDWIQVGLLDRGLRRSRGRHGTAPAVWPELQMRLLLKLVELRPRAGNPRAGTIAKLCRVPVWTWLNYGPEFVPVRQVRRALATWAKAALRVNEAAIRKMAAQWQQPHAARGSKGRFIEAVMDNLNSDAFDDATIVRSLDDLLALSAGEQLGPPGAKISGDIFASHLAMRREVLRTLHHTPDAMPDAWFEEARDAYHRSEAEYARQHARFAQDPAVGRMHPPRDPSDIFNDTCIAVADILGHLQMRPVIMHYAPEFVDALADGTLTSYRAYEVARQRQSEQETSGVSK